MTQNYKLNGEDYIKYESTDLDFINEMRDDWEKKNKHAIFITEYEVSRDYAEHLEKIVAHINKALPSDEEIETLGITTHPEWDRGIKYLRTRIQNILDGGGIV